MITCFDCACLEDQSKTCFKFVDDNVRVISMGYRRSFRSWADFNVAYDEAVGREKGLPPKESFYEAYMARVVMEIRCEEYDVMPDGVFRFCFKDQNGMISFGYQVSFENWDEFRTAYDREKSLMSKSIDIPPEEVFLEVYEASMLACRGESNEECVR